MSYLAIVAVSIVGAVLIAVGISMWSLAAGLVVAGAELVGGAYACAYIKTAGARGVTR